MKGTPVKIDELDSKILKILLCNGRIPFDELAAECGTDKNRVWKRYNSLEKKGVITGATIQMNFGLFGFDALATLMLRVDFQLLDQTMQYIKEIPEIRAYKQYNSIYNIRAIAILQSLNDLDHIKEIIKHKLPTLGLKSYVWTNVRNIPENLYALRLRNEEKSPLKPISPTNNFDFDDIDLKIVQKLSVDGRASFSQIAKKIGVSPHTVINRYEKMRKVCAIKVSIQINANKLGYVAIVDFNIAFTSLGDLSNTIVDKLTMIPDIIIITKTTGDFDLQVTAMLRNLKELFDIQDKIAKIKGITHIEASARRIPEKWPSAQQFISTM